MENFNFYSPTYFAFGKGKESEVGALVKRFGGSRVLLHYGGGSVKKNGVFDSVVKSLNEAGIPYIELGGVKPNPRSGHRRGSGCGLLYKYLAQDLLRD